MGDDSGAITRSPIIGRILSPVCRGGGGGGGGGGSVNEGGRASGRGSTRGGGSARSYFAPDGGLEDGLLSLEERRALEEEEALPISSFYKAEVIEILKLSLPVAVVSGRDQTSYHPIDPIHLTKRVSVREKSKSIFLNLPSPPDSTGHNVSARDFYDRLGLSRPPRHRRARRLDSSGDLVRVVVPGSKREHRKLTTLYLSLPHTYTHTHTHTQPSSLAATFSASSSSALPTSSTRSARRPSDLVRRRSRACGSTLWV